MTAKLKRSELKQIIYHLEELADIYDNTFSDLDKERVPRNLAQQLRFRFNEFN